MSIWIAEVPGVGDLLTLDELGGLLDRVVVLDAVDGRQGEDCDRGLVVLELRVAQIDEATIRLLLGEEKFHAPLDRDGSALARRFWNARKRVEGKGAHPDVRCALEAWIEGGPEASVDILLRDKPARASF